ncbi:MAG: hypothetical protein RXR06_09540 [Thermoproteus sp.]
MELSAAAAQASPAPSQCICLSMNDLVNFMLLALPILMLAFMFAVELAKELGLDKI